MKTFRSIGILTALFLGVNGIAQNPDQNPNYKVSQDKYMAQTDELTQTQGETIQETYEAFDWTEHKAQKKQDRKDRRYEIRKLRYQRNHFRPYYYQSGYPNPGYYNQGYYNNPGYYNNGYYGNGNSYIMPNCNANTQLYNSIILGSALYYLFN